MPCAPESLLNKHKVIFRSSEEEGNQQHETWLEMPAGLQAHDFWNALKLSFRQGQLIGQYEPRRRLQGWLSDTRIDEISHSQDRRRYNLKMLVNSQGRCGIPPQYQLKGYTLLKAIFSTLPESPYNKIHKELLSHIQKAYNYGIDEGYKKAENDFFECFKNYR